MNTLTSTVGASAYSPLTSSTESPVVIIYSTGFNLVADGLNETFNTSYESGDVNNLDRDNDGTEDEFDDMMVWLTRPLLYNRMVSSVRLP